MSPSDAGRPTVERIRPPAFANQVANPVMRRVLGSRLHGLASGLMLVRYRGRRSGRDIAVPVSRREHDGHIAAFTSSRWRLNFRGGHEAELVDRGRRRPVTGTLLEDPDAVADAVLALVAEGGWKAARRTFGLRTRGERDPTRDEVVEAIRRSGLSIVVFVDR